MNLNVVTPVNLNPNHFDINLVDKTINHIDRYKYQSIDKKIIVVDPVNGQTNPDFNTSWFNGAIVNATNISTHVPYANRYKNFNNVPFEHLRNSSIHIIICNSPVANPVTTGSTRIDITNCDIQIISENTTDVLLLTSALRVNNSIFTTGLNIIKGTNTAVINTRYSSIVMTEATMNNHVGGHFFFVGLHTNIMVMKFTFGANNQCVIQTNSNIGGVNVKIHDLINPSGYTGLKPIISHVSGYNPVIFNVAIEKTSFSNPANVDYSNSLTVYQCGTNKFIGNFNFADVDVIPNTTINYSTVPEVYKNAQQLTNAADVDKVLVLKADGSIAAITKANLGII